MFDTQQFVKGNVPPTKYLLDLELLIPDSIRIKKLLKKKVLPYLLFILRQPPLRFSIRKTEENLDEKKRKKVQTQLRSPRFFPCSSELNPLQS